MTVKQLGFACCQVVQKPFALIFHVPLFLWPDSARGSRVILPSGVNVILNLVPPGVEAVKGWPLKKVAWMSLGAIGSAAKAALAVSSMHITVNGPARIKNLLGAIIAPRRQTRSAANAGRRSEHRPDYVRFTSIFRDNSVWLDRSCSTTQSLRRRAQAVSVALRGRSRGQSAG